MTAAAYLQSLEAYRQSLDESLRRENGWLALAGLYWLEQGSNSLGSSPRNAVALPDPSLPKVMGELIVSGSEVSLKLGSGIAIEVDGSMLGSAMLRADVDGSPSVMRIHALQLMLIEREGAYAIRLWDNAREQRRTFPGRRWYPADPAYRVEAVYQPHPNPRPIMIERTIGTRMATEVVGQVSFEIEGSPGTLQALELDEGGLYLIFRDLSSGETTYPAGRYLTTEPPEGNQVVVDFNRAYNPPCAVTPFATCPLPPPENQLALFIAAGERRAG